MEATRLSLAKQGAIMRSTLLGSLTIAALTISAAAYADCNIDAKDPNEAHKVSCPVQHIHKNVQALHLLDL
jgi:hypothetical protein